MSRTREPRCHWDGEAWFNPEHLKECSEPGCRGCKPCPEDHCALRGSCPEHVQHAAGIVTCPSCIGRARKALNRIDDLYAVAGTLVAARTMNVGVLLEEAADDGVDSEALYLVGPAATPEQWSEKRRRLTMAFDSRGWCDYPRPEALADDDAHHPYAVLARWDQALREQYGPTTDLFVTVSSATDYLRKLLAGPFAHSREFEEFDGEIKAVQTHLEEVIHNSRVPEQGRQCPRCIELTGKGRRLQKRYAMGTSEAAKRGDLDTWHCQDVAEHWWSEKDYRDRVAADYIEHATALTADQLGQRLDCRPGTIRVWANRGKVTKRGRDHLGRQLYDVAEAEQAHRDTLADAPSVDEPAL